mmetsp:Transcript_55439/g.161902  ORF Transcript_55439/g.161902 Transcript_55439/m.161902 type:complete len:333 (-) Transcript_55439:1526-2524(-)
MTLASSRLCSASSAASALLAELQSTVRALSGTAVRIDKVVVELGERDLAVAVCVELCDHRLGSLEGRHVHVVNLPALQQLQELSAIKHAVAVDVQGLEGSLKRDGEKLVRGRQHGSDELRPLNLAVVIKVGGLCCTVCSGGWHSEVLQEGRQLPMVYAAVDVGVDVLKASLQEAQPRGWQLRSRPHRHGPPPEAVLPIELQGVHLLPRQVDGCRPQVLGEPRHSQQLLRARTPTLVEAECPLNDLPHSRACRVDCVHGWPSSLGLQQAVDAHWVCLCGLRREGVGVKDLPAPPIWQVVRHHIEDRVEHATSAPDVAFVGEVLHEDLGGHGTK